MSVLKMHSRDKNMWFYVPLLVLLFSFTINLLVSLLPNIGTTIYTGGIISIFIYMFVMGTITLPQTFPFALGLSITRRDFFLGTTAMSTIVSATMAFLLCISSQLERVTDHWGGSLHFFDMPYLNDGTIFEQFCIYFIMIMNMYFIGLLISSMHRRFGGMGLLILAVLMLLLFSLSGYILYIWWDTITSWLTHHSAFNIALWMIPITFCYAILSYWLLRRSTV
ncbi:hypothetical protein ACP8HI_26525 [Paenibacillus sp. FA6]|uniref:hypothetical protein n=1 Tax=Paenibacillus sp. FA6 TaxID=3413029 RepID=UPI003F65D0C9